MKLCRIKIHGVQIKERVSDIEFLRIRRTALQSAFCFYLSKTLRKISGPIFFLHQLILEFIKNEQKHCSCTTCICIVFTIYTKNSKTTMAILYYWRSIKLEASKSEFINIIISFVWEQWLAWNGQAISIIYSVNWL